jgi:hypothetical protein
VTDGKGRTGRLLASRGKEKGETHASSSGLQPRSRQRQEGSSNAVCREEMTRRGSVAVR